MAQKTLTEFAAAATTPKKSGDYDSIVTDDDLIEWSRDYAAQVVSEYDIEIDLSLVSWETTQDTKRQAAKTKTIKIPPAQTGVPIDWEQAREVITDMDADATAESDAIDDIRESQIVLSWSAFDAFDREEWEGTIRHELVHVWQHQQYGAADHGLTFKTTARKLDAPEECPKFANAKYHLLCEECGSHVADRYRRSKTVKQPKKYRSKCCSAPLEVEKGPAHPDHTEE